MRSIPHKSQAAVAVTAFLVVAVLILAGPAFAHDVSESNARFVEGIIGAAPSVFVYLGAKHMITGVDHVLFLLGVVFYLRNLREVILYASLFTLGHSLTLIFGVLFEIQASAPLVDAVIGLSVVYKALENLGAGKYVPKSFLPDIRIMVFVFGLVHGFGLATKLQALTLSKEGLLINLLSFNLGVEFGQALALGAMLLVLSIWRMGQMNPRHVFAVHFVSLTAGFILVGMHLFGFMAEKSL
ncbi:MAG: HupE/UreJ family protein [Pseudomonadota bacterium]